MSDDFDFNPKPKQDDKGIGKVDLGNTQTPEKIAADAAKKKTMKKWLIGGGAAVLGIGLVAGLAGVFNSSSEPATQTVNPPPVVQVEQQPTRPQLPPGVQTGVTADALQRQSLAAKEGSIYRDAQRAYYQTGANGQRTGGTGEAYLNINGQEVQRGQDFAVHVELFQKGQVSLLVASGPYAGSRIEFTPVGVRGGASVTYNRVGQEARGSDGSTVVYQQLASAQQTSQTVSMRSPSAAGNGVSLGSGTFEYQKMVREDGQFVPIYTISGDVEAGVFQVKIFNDDVYMVNFANGQYSVNSVYLFHPNWQEEYARTGVPVDASDVTTINGRLNVAPAVRPAPATGVQSSGPGMN